MLPIILLIILIYCLFDMFVWMENEFHILVRSNLNNELTTNSYINTLSNKSITKIVAHNIVNHFNILFIRYVCCEWKWISHLVDLILNNELTTNSLY